MLKPPKEESKIEEFKHHGSIGMSQITAEDSIMSSHAIIKSAPMMKLQMPDLNNLFHLTYNFDALKQAIEFLAQQ